MSNTNEVVTAQSVFADMAAYTVDSRGKLASIGGKLRVWAASVNMANGKDKDIVIAFCLAIPKADKTFVGKCLRLHADRKIVNEKGGIDGYKRWAACETDVEAETIKNELCGIVKKPTVEKTALEKAIAAVNKLESETDVAALLQHIQDKIVSKVKKAEKKAA